MLAWPEGISDGLSSPCAFCGRVPLIDYQVDDATWQRLVSPHTRQDVVCLDCLISMDLDAVAAVRTMQLATPRVTALFRQERVYRWHEYQQLSPCTHRVTKALIGWRWTVYDPGGREVMSGRTWTLKRAKQIAGLVAVLRHHAEEV